MSGALTGSVVLARAVTTLKQADIPDPARDARRLLCHVIGITAGRLTLVLPDPVDPAASARFDALIARRAAREPVSHLTGTRAFYGRDFIVTPDVLDPRPETETLIEAALSQPFDRVLDLGTGSGCIALTLLAETQGTQGIAAEISDEAMAVAQRNTAALALQDRLTLIRSHWFDAVTGTFDLIVSNPPYIADWEMADLAPEVRDYEPRIALTDEGDGLECYRAIFGAASPYLREAGRLIVEIGHDQAADVSAIAKDAGFMTIATLKDMSGKDRCIVTRTAQI